MPEGPKRAPGLYDVPVSNGAPCPTSAKPSRSPPPPDMSLTDEGDVIVDISARQTRQVRQASERGDAREDRVCLRASVTGQSVVPESLQGTSYRRLVLVVVTMGSCESREAEGEQTWTGHDDGGVTDGEEVTEAGRESMINSYSI